MQKNYLREAYERDDRHRPGVMQRLYVLCDCVSTRPYKHRKKIQQKRIFPCIPLNWIHAPVAACAQMCPEVAIEVYQEE